MTPCNETLRSKVQYSELNGRSSSTEVADQSKKVEENDAQYDPIPWDRLRREKGWTKASVQLELNGASG